ncbi:MAG: tRNA glutamyl-Q(34) synthetase GluQRS [Paracoccus sp. (in: a-proteobacteria)]|nr:tRNA glutamyl-Q(34) synthetase GluQRS [Paracoccus sp. (in: a-proteobacteria)]
MALRLSRTRFAPSPTGFLHLGHAFAALTAEHLADPGAFLLRIEYLDQTRCRTEFDAAIIEDMEWLGIDFSKNIMRQSQRGGAYRAALDRLAAMGVCYPCSCRRGDIRAALSAPQEGAPIHGPDGLIYPGTCRGREMDTLREGDVIRLDARRAFAVAGRDEVSFQDENITPDQRHTLSSAAFEAQIGDIVLERRGLGGSYHLAVVVDDAAQGITLVTRGKDLFESTWIHRLLQALLDLPEPRYHHHRLIRDEAGKRLAKRDDARSLRALRAGGASPQQIRALLGF